MRVSVYCKTIALLFNDFTLSPYLLIYKHSIWLVVVPLFWQLRTFQLFLFLYCSQHNIFGYIIYDLFCSKNGFIDPFLGLDVLCGCGAFCSTYCLYYYKWIGIDLPASFNSFNKNVQRISQSTGTNLNKNLWTNNYFRHISCCIDDFLQRWQWELNCRLDNPTVYWLNDNFLVFRLRLRHTCFWALYKLSQTYTQ